MAGPVTLTFGRERHHQVAHLGPVTEKIVPDQPIEVEWRGGPRIRLHRDHFRNTPRHCRRLLKDAPGRFEARPFGQVDDQLHLRLVVEGQQLHRDRLEIKHRHGDQRRDTHADQEQLGRTAGRDHPLGDPGVKVSQLAAVRRLVMPTVAC